MITPGTLNLRGGRWVPFKYQIDVRGLDLTGMTLHAQIRPDRVGDPALTGASPTLNLPWIADATDGASQGVRMTGVATVDGLPVSTIVLHVPKATMSAMPAGGDCPDATLSWDLQVIPGAGLEYVLLRGTFTVEAGVTQ